MAVRSFSNIAPPLALSAAASAVSVVLQVPSTAGYPSTPFTMAMERGTVREEVVLCTSLTATTFTVTRGYNGTTAVAHLISTAIEHTVAALDYAEANAHVNDVNGYSHNNLNVHINDPNGTLGGISPAGHTNLLNVTMFSARGDSFTTTAAGAPARVPIGPVGYVYTSLNGGLPGWSPVFIPTKTRRAVHSWAITGDIRVPSGDADFIPPILFSTAAGETATLVGWRCVIHGAGGGPSVTFNIQKNGSNTSGANSVATTVASSQFGLNVALGDGDSLAPVISAIAGTPKNLSISLYIDAVA